MVRRTRNENPDASAPKQAKLSLLQPRTEMLSSGSLRVYDLTLMIYLDCKMELQDTKDVSLAKSNGRSGLRGSPNSPLFLTGP